MVTLSSGQSMLKASTSKQPTDCSTWWTAFCWRRKSPPHWPCWRRPTWRWRVHRCPTTSLVSQAGFTWLRPGLTELGSGARLWLCRFSATRWRTSSLRIAGSGQYGAGCPKLTLGFLRSFSPPPPWSLNAWRQTWVARNRLRVLTPLDFRQQSQKPCKSFFRAITTMCNSGCSDCFPFFQQKIIYIYMDTNIGQHKMQPIINKWSSTAAAAQCVFHWSPF